MDTFDLNTLKKVIKTKAQEYTPEEKSAIQRGRAFYTASSSVSVNYEILKNPDPGVELRAIHVDGDSLVVGMGITIADADVAMCLAYTFTKDSRQAIFDREGKRFVKSSLKRLNDHSHLYFSTRDLGWRGLANRDFLVKGIWEIEKDGAAFLTYEDAAEQDLEKDFTANTDNVVASVQTAFMFEPLASIGSIAQTRITAVVRVDLKGTIPNVVMNSLAGKSLASISKLRSKLDRSADVDAGRRSGIMTVIKNAEKLNDDSCIHRIDSKEKRDKVREEQCKHVVK